MYAVWFNMLPGDSRGEWEPGILTDPRVVEYWDPHRALGQLLGDRRDDLGIRFLGGPVVWDASLLFGPDAQWNDLPGPVEHFAYTIFGERRGLEGHLNQLWAE